MELTPEERDLLAGGQGESVRRALEMQVAVGEFFGAERMVPVASVHAAGDAWIMGDAGLEWLEACAAEGARFRVPTTYNPCSVDLEHWEQFGQPPEHVAKERRVHAALQALDIVLSQTCINYQTVTPARFGEHVGWGDTGAVIFANSVIGARSNYEGGPAAVAAALTGRVPAYGYHLDAQRRGTLQVQVREPLREWADWSALGCWVGRQLTSYWEVPVLVLEGEAAAHPPGVDDLKHLGASLASFGSYALFHLVGVTPEAPTLEAAFGIGGGRHEPTRRLVLERGGLEAVYASFRPRKPKADLVVFTAPQLSIHEVHTIAGRLRGRRVHPDTRVYLTVSPQVLREAERLGYAQWVAEAGGQMLSGVCFYVMTPELLRERFGWETIVTNSAKLANIIEGAGYNPVLRRLDACIEAALTGAIA